MLCATLPGSSWRSLRSKGRPFRSSSGSPDGHFLAGYWRYRGKSGAFRSGDRAFDPVAHRALATRFSQDHRVSVLPYRAFALWALGYPEAALADAERAISDARAIGQAATLMYALVNTSFYIHVTCGNYATANMHLDELVTLADEKGALLWKAIGMAQRGCVMALTGKHRMMISGLTSRNRQPPGQREQHCGCHSIFHAWRALMLILGSSMTLGAASAKP